MVAKPLCPLYKNINKQEELFPASIYPLKERIEGKIKLRIIFFQKKSSINLSFYSLILEKMYDLTFVIIEKVCNFLVFIIEKVYLCKRNI